jgi:hypothetical protein
VDRLVSKNIYIMGHSLGTHTIFIYTTVRIIVIITIQSKVQICYFDLLFFEDGCCDWVGGSGFGMTLVEDFFRFGTSAAVGGCCGSAGRLGGSMAA